MRIVRTMSAATLSLLMCAVTLTTPAGAGEQDAPRASKKGCDPGEHSQATVLARGGTAREPALDQAHQDMPASAKGKAGASFEVTVPVYFHVVTDGATGALTNAQIASQVRVLNNTFGGGEGGADTGFSFELAGVTRTDNAGWFYANPAARTSTR